MNNSISCPICSKNIPSSDAEIHVDRCIFLNSESAVCSSSKQKRVSISNISKNEILSPSPKRQKVNVNTSKNAESSEIPPKKLDDVPLAEKMRPSNLEEYYGQEHIVGKGEVLRNLLDTNEVPSMILWGPPGCGKTTLASIISKRCESNTRFQKLSATMSGVNDVKEMVKIAKNEIKFKRKTILFMDEIHRFNKLQQDIFLPHVENGTITLIGATTENPSFSLNSALLSRCRVIVLEKLSSNDLISILTRAFIVHYNGEILTSNDTTENFKKGQLCIERTAIDWLADMCDGDARIALNTLQLAVKANQAEDSNKPICLSTIEDSLKKSHMMYDKKGDEHYNMISALHKSIRASDDNAALYWTTRMLVSGEDPLYVGRRLIRAASEDIGLADPNALPLAISAVQGCQLIGMPECDVLLAECAVYLARAPKSTEVYRALNNCKDMIKNWKGPQPGVPLHLRNAPTKLMRELGYGKGYNTKHKSQSELNYLPEEINTNFFHHM